MFNSFIEYSPLPGKSRISHMYIFVYIETFLYIEKKYIQEPHQMQLHEIL